MNLSQSHISPLTLSVVLSLEAKSYPFFFFPCESPSCLLIYISHMMVQPLPFPDSRKTRSNNIILPEKVID